MILLWRDAWFKPLADFDIGLDRCSYCKNAFHRIDFVTSCDFCDNGIMHDSCANKHILSEHNKQLETKINSNKDRPQQLNNFFR